MPNVGRTKRRQSNLLVTCSHLSGLVIDFHDLLTLVQGMTLVREQLQQAKVLDLAWPSVAALCSLVASFHH